MMIEKITTYLIEKNSVKFHHKCVTYIYEKSILVVIQDQFFSKNVECIDTLSFPDQCVCFRFLFLKNRE